MQHEQSKGEPTSKSLTSEAVVREFWRLMETNEFYSVKSVLAEEFIAEWPQSNERICGGDNYARINAEYPAKGKWKFQINTIVASEETIVTQVSFTDGVLSAEPISFFTVFNGKITRLVEYFPEPYIPPKNRSHLVEPLKPESTPW